jgi:hypothetical protein
MIRCPKADPELGAGQGLVNITEERDPGHVASRRVNRTVRGSEADVISLASNRPTAPSEGHQTLQRSLFTLIGAPRLK